MDKKISKSIYLLPSQMEKAKKIQEKFSKESKTKFSFNATILRLIEERK